jgi:hypothetical protein
LERQELWELYSVNKLKDAAFVTWWELLWNMLQLLDILCFYISVMQLLSSSDADPGLHQIFNYPAHVL